MKIFTYEEIKDLSPPEKLISYSEAYLHAAITLCESMVSEPVSCTWARGSVVLMLGAHATELFVKGALLFRAPDKNFLSEKHDLELLKSLYGRHFPEEEYRLTFPFSSGPVSPELTIPEPDVSRRRVVPPSVLYRFPIANDNKDWQWQCGFEPVSFLGTLREFKADQLKVLDLIRSELH